MVEAIIALGSNEGDREANLGHAITAIGLQSRVTQVSSVYETEPMYVEDQAWFLNCVIAVETELLPRDLIESFQAVEARLGRKRSRRYGPRVIDIDILFYGSFVISEEGLTIPHPRIAERLFVLAPLAEIRPDLVHPVLKKTVWELLASLKDEKKVVKRPELLADYVSRSPPQA
jgi:2-amino-4-hydroxy-6-hydroxymethyldihydropteridine diphosphokinase